MWRNGEGEQVQEQAARTAVVRVRAARHRAVAQAGEIADLSDRLASARETNHFADLIRSLLNGGGSSHEPD